MSLPGFTDSQDEAVALLRQIAENTGSLEQNQDVTLEGSNIQQRMGVIPAGTVVIKETADMDSIDGTAVTLSPGDEQTLASYREGSTAVYAYGATDASNVIYWLEVDGNLAVGPTRGPLGTINSPFSFVANYGGAVPSDSRVKLKARYPASESGEVDLVARMHLEVVQ